MLEAAGYFNESDFTGLELLAYQEMFWRGGPTPTADMNVSLQAGTTLGGGTTINWTNCLRTKRLRCASSGRASTASRASTGRTTTATSTRCSSGSARPTRRSDLNGPHQRMKEGADKLGWHFATIVRNADLDKLLATRRPATSASATPSGAKLSGEKTWLRDAFENGAEFLVRTRAQRVLVEDGRAAGRRGGLHGRRRHRGARGHRARADRGRRVRRARVAGAAAALGHRRAGGRRLPAAAPGGRRVRPVRRPTSRRSCGAPQAGLVDEFAGRRATATAS